MGRSVRLVAALVVALAAGRAGAEAPPGKLVVVLADASISVPETNWQKRYQEPYHAVCERIGQGDRIVLAPITSRSLTGYLPVLDRSFKPRTGRLLTDRYSLDADRAAAEKAFLELKHDEKKSQVLDATTMAGELFAGDPDRTDRWLVILSDMLESSESADFEKVKLDEKKVRAIIDARRKKGLLPKLDGVRVFVAGASAANSEKYAEVRRFWEAYFKETGAVLGGDGWYSAATPHLPNPGSR